LGDITKINDKFFNIRVDQPSGGIDEVVIRGKMKFSSIKKNL